MKTNLVIALLLLFSHITHSVLGNGVCIIDASLGMYLDLKSSSVDVVVNNQIAVVTATQEYHNTTGLSVPFRYAFPLHATANAIDLKWYINGKWHKVIISANAQSDSLPGGGGGHMHTDLKEYLGESPIMVTPLDEIMPDSSVTFIFKYVELLPYAFGVVDFSYPNDYSTLQPEALDHQHFHFQLNSDRTIQNIWMETWTAEMEQMSHSATINLDLYEVPADHSYEVHYELSSTELGVLKLSTFLPDSLLHCDEYGNGYVSLIIEPESNANTEVIEKNFSLIIDRSGSMSGQKIEQARNAAAFIVNNLNAGDNFNIIDFSTEVRSLFPSLVPYTTQRRDQALMYINQISAFGSTNISGALTSSIQQFQAIDTTKANIIIFFTDGEATVGVTDVEGILSVVENAVNTTETDIFLFTFGIGLDVSKKLLTLLALENNGLATFLENDELEEKISNFFLTINNPVLINTQFAFEPDIITEVYPSPLPNLYKGQQLILTGRYVEPLPVNLRLSGKAFNLPVTYDFPILLSDSNDVEKSFLPKIWAKQAIDQHTVHFNLATSEHAKDSIQAIIDSISICYGVISTQFTSFEDGGHTAVMEYDTSSYSSTYSMSISPNPFLTDFIIHIRSKVYATEAVQVVIMDATGRPVLHLDDFIDGNVLDIPVVFPEAKPAGVYYIMVSIGKEIILHQVAKL